MENNYNEFVSLLKKKLPDTEIMEFRTRSLETLKGVVLTIGEVGLLEILWNIFTLWISKHANASINISYKTKDGKSIDVTYNKLNKKEVEEILSQNPPALGSSTKIILP